MWVPTTRQTWYKPVTADDPRLGCPVEYINLKGTSYDKPAVCKYTGNKFYSDTWRKYGTKE